MVSTMKLSSSFCQHLELLEQAGKLPGGGRMGPTGTMVPMKSILELLVLKDQVPDVLEVNHLVQVKKNASPLISQPLMQQPLFCCMMR